MIDLRSVARALGGDIAGRQVVFPPPGHSLGDRSACLRFEPRAPGGFVVHSFAGEDPLPIRDYVRERLGLGEGDRPDPRPAVAARLKTPQNPDRIELARRIWRETLNPRDTIVERYLASRRLILPDDVAGDVIRFHPRAAFRNEAGDLVRMPAMVVAMRNVRTDDISGVQRTFLRPDATKADRRMLGTAGGAAIKLDADEAVHGGLVIGEGTETVLAARQLGYRPAWALGSVDAIAAFPVLSGIEALTILEETGAASARAVRECGARWHAAGREVRVVRPKAGSDINDAIRQGVA